MRSPPSWCAAARIATASADCARCSYPRRNATAPAHAIADAVRLLPTELEDALAELVVRGRVNCDSFAGLRALLVPAAKRSSAHARRRRGVALMGIADAGRWSLIRSSQSAGDGGHEATPAPATRRADADALEHVARILLRRYGVVCWRLLEREAAWLPPWRDLVRVYRRLEARGEIRGGRFIAGITGEQFALPEAIASMREVRRRPPDDALVCLAASDPANLLGTVVAGPKVARIAGARVVWRDGVPVATSVGGEVEMLVPLDRHASRAVSDALRQGPVWRLPVDAPSRESTPSS